MHGGDVFLLSGGRRRGKSTALANLVAFAGQQDVVIGGLLSPRVSDGINTILLPDNLELPLARYERYPTTDDTPRTGPLVGPYRFSSAVIERANAHLQSICTRSGKVLSGIVLDEIGPLELIRNAGFRPGLDYVLRQTIPLVVVIRPELVEELTRLVVISGRSVGVVLEDPRPVERAVSAIFEYITTERI